MRLWPAIILVVTTLFSFLICDSCGDVAEIQSEGLQETLDSQAKQHGFKVSKQTIEAHGLCADCQQTEDHAAQESVHEC